MPGGPETASAHVGGTGVCRHCGATYHKTNAKFCSRCGASRDAASRSSNGGEEKKTGTALDANGPDLAATVSGTSTSTMPSLFSTTKVSGDGAVATLDGGKRTLRPFDVAQLQQQLSRKETTADAASTALEFRDPSESSSLTSPKRHPPNSTPVSTAAAAATATASSSSTLTSLTAIRANGARREGTGKSAIYAKDTTLPELPPASLADPRRFTRHHSESSAEAERANDAVDGVASARTPMPPREQPPSQGGRPSSASGLRVPSRRRTSKSQKQETAVEDTTAFAATIAMTNTNAVAATANDKEAAVEDDVTAEETAEAAGSLLHPSAEEEAQYTAWATLPPDGLTPEMLQTSNATELRRWRKGSLIGRGTYGSVYLGLLPDGSFYAVKCVELGNKRAATDHLNVLELVSLSREINMMHRLRHRNLCTFKGVYYDADNTSICMFMEYIGGGSLSSLVKRFKPLPPSVVRSWTLQLLSGLKYLHTQHIIHRDIKGDNVLVDTSADPSTLSQIKLVDFGAARRLTDAVSQSSTVIGTPYWMAPEVVDASGDGGGYSYKADVWSVGCTVAEMLTGRPPWPCKTSAPAAIMMIASATGMPTEIPEAEATPGCLDFMHQCFTRDPEKRPTVQMLLQHPWIQGKTE